MLLVVVMMEIERSLKVFLMEVVIIIGLLTTAAATFFALYQAVVMMRKIKINSADNFDVTIIVRHSKFYI